MWSISRCTSVFSRDMLISGHGCLHRTCLVYCWGKLRGIRFKCTLPSVLSAPLFRVSQHNVHYRERSAIEASNWKILITIQTIFWMTAVTLNGWWLDLREKWGGSSWGGFNSPILFLKLKQGVFILKQGILNSSTNRTIIPFYFKAVHFTSVNLSQPWPIPCPPCLLPGSVHKHKCWSSLRSSQFCSQLSGLFSMLSHLSIHCHLHEHFV